MADSTVTRRSAIVLGAAAVTAGVGACSSGSGDQTTNSPPATTPSGTSAGTTVDVATVPVGGGVILKDQQIVVTQPVAGTFKAFTAICTHQGCIVSSVSGGTINCACHQSVYSAATGAVESGPAPSALAAKTVTRSGSSLTVS